MNSRRVIIFAFVIDFFLVVGTATAYILKFGASPASQDRWGQFGDFFGGILNPLFGMLAFLAVLWSIWQQERELRQASMHLSVQAEVARQELKQLRDDRDTQDLIHVIKEIDARLEGILKTEVLDFPRFSRQKIISEITERKLNERYQIYS